LVIGRDDIKLGLECTPRIILLFNPNTFIIINYIIFKLHVIIMFINSFKKELLLILIHKILIYIYIYIYFNSNYKFRSLWIQYSSYFLYYLRNQYTYWKSVNNICVCHTHYFRDFIFCDTYVNRCMLVHWFVPSTI